MTINFNVSFFLSRDLSVHTDPWLDMCSVGFTHLILDYIYIKIFVMVILYL